MNTFEILAVCAFVVYVYTMLKISEKENKVKKTVQKRREKNEEEFKEPNEILEALKNFFGW